ncbi:MAG: TlpA family protein disulfide reductase [Anaerolineales bacterium]|nr:TlpA family protein disulfide reductase [Anaerolineales bacterium]
MNENNPTPPAPRRGAPLWVQILVFAALLGLLVLVGLGLARAQQPIIAVGAAVPDFTLTLFDGYAYNGAGEVSLTDLRGQVVVINFWASWCKPCEEEAADLEAAWRHYAAQAPGRVIFLGIDYVDTEPQARSYLAKFEISFPNGPDMGTRISQAFNRTMGVPETYIIDQNGILVHVQIGPFLSVAEIQRIIDPLLGR